MTNVRKKAIQEWKHKTSVEQSVTKFEKFRAIQKYFSRIFGTFYSTRVSDSEKKIRFEIFQFEFEEKFDWKFLNFYFKFVATLVACKYQKYANKVEEYLARELEEQVGRQAGKHPAYDKKMEVVHVR